jgi:hypothetical protein
LDESFFEQKREGKANTLSLFVEEEFIFLGGKIAKVRSKKYLQK